MLGYVREMCDQRGVIASDLEDAGVGGRCPWKRLGELERLGYLVVTGTTLGYWGREVKVYGLAP